MEELLVVPEELLLLRRTVDEPRPAKKANTMTATMIRATTPFLMPQRVAS
jgi:hypothetical protein